MAYLSRVQGYNSTCKGEKNPSVPSMKPFVGFKTPYNNDPRGPSCQTFFSDQSLPIGRIGRIFHFILPKTSLFGLALLYLPYKAYGTRCFSIKIHEVNTGGRSLIAPVCPNYVSYPALTLPNIRNPKNETSYHPLDTPFPSLFRKSVTINTCPNTQCVVQLWYFYLCLVKDWGTVGKYTRHP